MIIIRELIRYEQKLRTIIFLKKKKFTKAEVSKCNGAQINLHSVMNGIKSA